LTAWRDLEVSSGSICKLGKIGENPEIPGKRVRRRNLKGRDSSFLDLP